MANALYTKAKELMLNAGIDWDSDTLKVALVKNTYPQNLSADQYYDDISDYVVGTPVEMTGVTITNGVFNADPVVFSAVSAGDTLEAVVIYKDTGNTATSPLLIYIDTLNAFPMVTNGGDITIRWDPVASKIFSL